MHPLPVTAYTVLAIALDPSTASRELVIAARRSYISNARYHNGRLSADTV